MESNAAALDEKIIKMKPAENGAEEKECIRMKQKDAKWGGAKQLEFQKDRVK